MQHPKQLPVYSHVPVQNMARYLGEMKKNPEHPLIRYGSKKVGSSIVKSFVSSLNVNYACPLPKALGSHRSFQQAIAEMSRDDERSQAHSTVKMSA